MIYRKPKFRYKYCNMRNYIESFDLYIFNEGEIYTFFTYLYGAI